MKIKFNYRKPILSDIEAPYLEIVLSDPIGNHSVSCDALIDTGYDGELVVPMQVYKEINLDKFELSEEFFTIAETPTGENLKLNSANGLVKIKGFDIEIEVIIDSYRNCKEILIGRKLLEDFICVMNGPAKELSIEFLEEEH
ncbi:MAG: clan AA aspartic protease [Candidatus Heimdallarchaeaceae archaeon]